MPRHRAIAVYLGAREGRDPAFAEAAAALGRLLAEQGRSLIYGGGRVGLMGVVADAALAAGGEVIGVIPQALMARELGHRQITRLEVVASMHERKARMAELADAVVAAPGGYGTLDELLEVLTFTQLGLHRKPAGLLNIGGYWDGLLAQIARAADEQFMASEHAQMLCTAPDPGTLLHALDETTLPPARAEVRNPITSTSAALT